MDIYDQFRSYLNGRIVLPTIDHHEKKPDSPN